MKATNANGLARISGALLIAFANAQTMAEARCLGPQFGDIVEHIKNLLEERRAELDRASEAAKEDACGWDIILRRALYRLGFAIREGNLDFAVGSPLIGYHVQRAQAGNYMSARWLRDNVRVADKAGRPVDPYVRFAVEQMRKGGLRKSRRMRGRGQRGPSLGNHNQILLAREMWKQRHLRNYRISPAAMKAVHAFPKVAYDSAVNAYYRGQRGAKRRTLYFELVRDFHDDRDGWRSLAGSDERLESTLRKLQRLRPFTNS